MIEIGLLGTPFTVTTTFPVVAPKEPALRWWSGSSWWRSSRPVEVTVLAPCVAPKFVPVIVTKLPIVADVVDKLESPVSATP